MFCLSRALKKQYMKQNLLTRNDFRHQVFERDGYKCVICGELGLVDENGISNTLDAHHIIERRLWKDGGYYVDNGATLCNKHHIEAEKTILSCDDIRDKTGIKTVVIPEHFYDDV